MIDCWHRFSAWPKFGQSLEPSPRLTSVLPCTIQLSQEPCQFSTYNVQEPCLIAFVMWSHICKIISIYPLLPFSLFLPTLCRCIEKYSRKKMFSECECLLFLGGRALGYYYFYFLFFLSNLKFTSKCYTLFHKLLS